MPSDEAVKAATKLVYSVSKWRGHSPAFMQAMVKRWANLLDRMMAQARLEEHEPSCGLCLTRKNNHGIRCRYGAELERLAGRGK